MPNPVFSISVITLKDLEAACQEMRKIAGDDSAVVVLRGDWTRDVKITLVEHDLTGVFSVQLDTVNGEN